MGNNTKNEAQIERCLALTAELWSEFLLIPISHPNQVSEFGGDIHSLQEKLALQIARIHRPDLFPNKVLNEPS